MEELFTKDFDLKAAEGADGEVVAYLTTFENEDKVGDIIKVGALDAFVKNFDPEVQKLPMLYNHNVSSIIGEWKALEVDANGVKGTGILYTETTQGSDVYKLLKREAVASVSIGFRSQDYDVLKSGGRSFNEIELVETSIVLNPANPKAQILSVKSEDGFIQTKSLKAVLKDAGLNRNEIEALFQHGWKGLVNLRANEAEAEDFVSILKDFKL